MKPDISTMIIRKCFLSLRLNLNRVIKFRYSSHSDVTKCDNDLKRIRNIGILAHIDAGKTTTTERMLYYSGIIDHMGEVHHGNTVTDYLEQERDRGITITSASVTIPWLNSRINIIDTPGHIDFTYEVEKSLNVIDGAIIILDGSQGVEAQTMTVWRQADKYNIPRIVYVNKMDRLDSSFEMCLKSLKLKFQSEFLPLQIPIRSEKTGIASIVDVISKTELKWSGERGEIITRTPLHQDSKIAHEANKLRVQLVDKLSTLDDPLANLILEEGSLDSIGIVPIYDSLRRVTVAQKAVPVLCGSSYKNVGVQKLMDAVIDILPSPDLITDLNDFDAFKGHLCARAFKVIHDNQKGAVTFLRIYSGSMIKGQKIYNVTKRNSEQIQRLMVALADEYKDVSKMTAGNIVAVTGLKAVNSGNTITNSESSFNNAVKLLSTKTKRNTEECINRLSPPIIIPEPVFFRSIEAPSMRYQTALDNALEQLQREDASLKVKVDPDTGQTILGGMGELHLEIIKDRIFTSYKIDADLGPLQVVYKEFLNSSATDTHTSDINIGNVHHSATISMSILPKQFENQALISLDKSPENISNTSMIHPRLINLMKNGISTTLQRGPKVGCPVVNASFIIHSFLAKRNTSDSVITCTTSHCVQKLLLQTSTIIMEPIMELEVVTDEKNMTYVMSDLSRRRASISDFFSRGENRVIRAEVPLAELLGYSKKLRIETSGNAAFTMEFKHYREISGISEAEAIKNITGFYPL